MQQLRILDGPVNFCLDPILVRNRRMDKLVCPQADTFFCKFHVVRHDDKRNLEIVFFTPELLNNLEAVNYRESRIKQRKRYTVPVLQQNIKDMLAIFCKQNIIISLQDFFENGPILQIGRRKQNGFSICREFHIVLMNRATINGAHMRIAERQIVNMAVVDIGYQKATQEHVSSMSHISHLPRCLER